ncbi:hypothetical protein T492DRAFT_1009135 [Pavlovales sp. CCMP2436]|nr:hypothetical protein T492DRAFT_1009135 [Pavlovales sp. CCMP2436]
MLVVVPALLLLAAGASRTSRFSARAPARSPCVRAWSSRIGADERPDPPVRSILDLEQFQRVKQASEVVAVAAARSRGRGKEANDVLIRELVESTNVDASIQLHYEWVSSLKFLRGVQVRLEESAPGSARAAELEGLMARIRAEMQARMDAAQQLLAASLGSFAADPLAMRALARRGLLDEALVMMLVGHAAEVGKKVRQLEATSPATDPAPAKLESLLQRLAQDAMRELDLPVAPEFVVLRRLLQMRAPAARTALAARATAGDKLVTDRPVDLPKLIDVVREFRRIEVECAEPDEEAASKLAIVERELIALARTGGGGSAP